MSILPDHHATQSTAEADHRHPDWCAVERCTVHQPDDGYHRSAPAVVDAVLPGQVSLLAQLWQPGYLDGDGPTLVLTISDDLSLLPQVHSYDVEGWQVVALLDALAPLAAVFAAGSAER